MGTASLNLSVENSQDGVITVLAQASSNVNTGGQCTTNLFQLDFEVLDGSFDYQDPRARLAVTSPWSAPRPQSLGRVSTSSPSFHDLMERSGALMERE